MIDERATDKVCTLSEAIAEHVHPGDALYLAGMAHGEVSAAVHEILRQKINSLTLIRPVSEIPSLLISEGRVETLIHAYTSVLYPKRGYAAVRVQERGYSPHLIEFSHFGLNLALQAGQMGIPFMPTITQLGSDIVTYNPEYITEVQDPFSGQKLAAVRAVTPDVGIVHVQKADKLGNAQKWGSLGMDSAGLHASRRVIVTAEQLVDSKEIRKQPDLTLIPGLLVSAVVEEPWGAYPRHLLGYYDDDVLTFLEQIDTEKGYEEYMTEFVYGVQSRTEMMKKVRHRFGDDHLERLLGAAKRLTPLER